MSAEVARAKKPGKPRSRRKRSALHRRILKVLGTITLCLAMLTALTAMYVWRDLNSKINVLETKIDEKAEVPADPAAGESLNILIMGDDTREGEGNKIDGESGAGGSDTTILVHISADRTRAYGISIPRDTMVDRPDCAPQGKYPGGSAADNVQWNAAFALGGPSCTIAQFQMNSNLHVDHFVVVDFNGMKNMVDAIGGVRMCVPFDLVDDRYLHTTIKAGKNRLLDGEEARNYVRMRHIEGLDGSDLSRTRRQQAFIGAMAKQVLSAGTLANPIKVKDFLGATLETLTVDTGLGKINDIAGLAMQFQNIGLDDIQFITIPFEAYPADPNRVQFSGDAETVFQAIRKDKRIPQRLLTGVQRADGGRGPTSTKPGAGNPTSSPSGSATSDPTDPATGGSSDPATPTSTPTIKDAVPATIYDNPEKLGLCS